jgi:hypothetical protein
MRLQEEMRVRQVLMEEKATLIQSYARVWLAKRYTKELQEQQQIMEKERLKRALAEMADQVRTCGTDSKSRFEQAAISIQKVVRGKFIRRLLAPYFDLYRKVNPLVYYLTRANTTIR